MCKHCSADLCSGYYGVHKLHLHSKLRGISIGFRVSSTDKTTFKCAAWCSQSVLHIMFGYYSGFPHSHAAALWALHICMKFPSLRKTTLYSGQTHVTVDVRWDQQIASPVQFITRSWGLFFYLLSMSMFSIHRQTQSDRKRNPKIKCRIWVCSTILIMNQTTWFIMENLCCFLINHTLK